MSNLQSAKSAIKAEIAHARQGLDFYKYRVESLEKTLDQLDTVILPENAVDKKTGKHFLPVKTRAARGRRPGAHVSSATRELPSTGADYWLDLITDEPQSAAEILKKAVGNLGFQAAKPQIQKLRQRLAPALKSLVEAQKIQDSGKGRERRYVRS